MLKCERCGQNDKMKHRKVCKPCHTKDIGDYKKTKKGVVSVIYHNQIHNTKRRGMEDVSYNQQELYHYLTTETNFNDVYSKWVSSGYEKSLKPSIDRLNDYEPYRLDNIQVLSQKDHFAKSGLDRVEGFNLKASTPVLRIDSNGNTKEYYSIHNAARDTSTYYQNIWNVCKGNRKTAGGYKWRFINEQ